MKRYYIYGFSFIFFLFVSIVLWSCMCSSKNRLEKCYVKKEHTIKSEYSENQRIYSQVYCEDEFDFKKQEVLPVHLFYRYLLTLMLYALKY